MRGLIGVIHLPPLPGDPAYGGGGTGSLLSHALFDATALTNGGVDALLVENFGSAPFHKGTEGDRLPPCQVATLAIIARELKRRFSVPLGINCLRNDALSAIGIAAAAGADFVRVNVHTGTYATDQGIIEGEAAKSLRYRSQIEALPVRILADVLVKHAEPIRDVTPEDATKDCLFRGRADGIIVTGTATGAPVDRRILERVRSVAKRAPVLIGSGLTIDNASDLCPLADGAIVGTYFKVDGDIRNRVDESRVKHLSAFVSFAGA